MAVSERGRPVRGDPASQPMGRGTCLEAGRGRGDCPTPDARRRRIRPAPPPPRVRLRIRCRAPVPGGARNPACTPGDAHVMDTKCGGTAAAAGADTQSARPLRRSRKCGIGSPPAPGRPSPGEIRSRSRAGTPDRPIRTPERRGGIPPGGRARPVHGPIAHSRRGDPRTVPPFRRRRTEGHPAHPGQSTSGQNQKGTFVTSALPGSGPIWHDPP